MGYRTDFFGEMKVSPTPSDEFIEKFNDFCEGRHSDEGENDEDGDGSLHTDCTKFPGRWCYWHLAVSDDSEDVVLRMPDYEENVDAVTEWLSYLVKNWLQPNGYRLKGQVTAFGEGAHDYWKISAYGFVVKFHKGKIKYDSGKQVSWQPAKQKKTKSRPKEQLEATA